MDKRKKKNCQKPERKKNAKKDERNPSVARNQSDELFESNNPNLSGVIDGLDADRQGACSRSSNPERDPRRNPNVGSYEYLGEPTQSTSKELKSMVNFRSLPVIPTTDELFRPSFLRPNIVKGKYSSTEHYLDVQYRLLREDYVESLREGIKEYLNDGGKSVANYKNAQVYKNVRIVHEEFVKGTKHHLVQFSAGLWESNNCVRLDSLLCLSSDNFKTMMFASVAYTDPMQLNNGLLLIRFEEEELNISATKNFVMIETFAYFEAFRHNLKALQELNEAMLPLKEYIVHVKTEVGHPRYLDPSTMYDIRPLLLSMDSTHINRETTADGELSFRYNFPCDSNSIKSVKILDDSNWPAASDLNLDSSHYCAIKAALTREFTIIQGPPGTGKTYVGLRIVQLLLHNKDKWFREATNSLPILIVCVTNHVLDKFLEGILSFTDKIVRIGGQGKNDAVSHFQLCNLKTMPRHICSLPDGIATALRNQNEKIARVGNGIQELSSLLQRSSYHVLGEEELKRYIPLIQYISLISIAYEKNFEVFGVTDNGLIIHDWLGISPRLCWYRLYIPPEARDDQVVNFQLIPENSYDELAYTVVTGAEYVEKNDIDNDFLIYDNNGQLRWDEDLRLKYIKDSLNNSRTLDEAEASKILNVWHLDMTERWNLYKYWLQRMVTEKKEEHLALQAQLKTLHEELREIKTEENLHVIKRAHVLGMTTTGAAKYRNLVRNANPQILIVEEAAQILESHIATALAPNTQHLILIGDHKQLRPAPNVHKLAVKYNADISLFERMIKNRMEYITLSVQYRMRPDIKDLISPHIYDKLNNHPSVTGYENIKGIGKNMYFVTHKCSEMYQSDSKSKSNNHEARFMVRLCNYLVQQDYDASQITVLTIYRAQLSAMKKIAEEFPKIQDVRFTVVDNYQGEENDIILISFVRSNDDGDIGFLNTENRVCVAFSRAKKGLYCIGDFEMFAEKSILWKKITQTLKQKAAIGQSLQLSCQNHPNVYKEVYTAKDFDSVSEGGCTVMCNYRLSCGHVCSLNCHPYDREHLNVRCFKNCNRKCEDGHSCPLKCYEECQPCEFLVDYRFPECGHTTQVPCYSKWEMGAELCRQTVSVKSPICGHIIEIECHNRKYSETWTKYCKFPCNIVLECGHNCQGNCDYCHQGRLHVSCNQPCKRILVCGHACPSTCASHFKTPICPPCPLPCENRCIHSKCPRKCGEPCATCAEECIWHCRHKRCFRLCGELCSRNPCNKPCRLFLKCGHRCIGFCGEPCPEECRVCDSDAVKEIFFGTEDDDDARFVRLEDCGHILEKRGLSEWMEVNKLCVQMKVCPKCKTVIRTNLRFGNVVKCCLKMVEQAKERIFGNVDSNKRFQQMLLEKIEQNVILLTTSKSCPLQYECFKILLSSEKCYSRQELTCIENVVTFTLQLSKLEFKDTSYIHRVNGGISSGISEVTQFARASKLWLIDCMRKIFTISEQQFRQISCEVHRLELSSTFVNFSKEHFIKFPNPDFTECVRILTSHSPFGESSDKRFSETFIALEASCESAEQDPLAYAEENPLSVTEEDSQSHTEKDLPSGICTTRNQPPTWSSVGLLGMEEDLLSDTEEDSLSDTEDLLSDTENFRVANFSKPKHRRFF